MRKEEKQSNDSVITPFGGFVIINNEALSSRHITALVIQLLKEENGQI